MVTVHDTLSGEELESLGRRVIAWAESEKLLGLDAGYDTLSVERLLSGALPPPVRSRSIIGDDGERYTEYVPATFDDSPFDKIGHLHLDYRMLFFGYSASEGPDVQIGELRKRAQEAIGLSVTGGSNEDNYDEDDYDEDET